MTENTPKTPRVIRRGGENEQVRVIKEQEFHSETFTDFLSSGRQITMREMTAGDLLFMEKSLPNAGETERALKLASRLSTGDGRITFEDATKLTMKDMRLLTDLLVKAGGQNDEDEDDFPNE
jgi:hypothetical protein